MSDEQKTVLSLNEIEARALATTPGRWRYDSYNRIHAGDKVVCEILDHPQDDGPYEPNQIAERSAWYAESAKNACFIEHSRNDVLALVAALREREQPKDAPKCPVTHYANSPCRSCGKGFAPDVKWPEQAVGDVYDEIRAERRHQDEKWGGEAHDDEHGANDWLDIIDRLTSEYDHGEDARKVLVQIAAVAVAAIETRDRAAQRG